MQKQHQQGGGDDRPEEKKIGPNKAAQALVAKAEQFLEDSQERIQQAAQVQERKQGGCGCGF